MTISAPSSKATVALAVATSVAAVVFYVKREDKKGKKQVGVEEVMEQSQHEIEVTDHFASQTKFVTGEKENEFTASEHQDFKPSADGLLADESYDDRAERAAGQTKFLSGEHEQGNKSVTSEKSSEDVDIDKTHLTANQGGDKVKPSEGSIHPVVAAEPSPSNHSRAEDKTEIVSANKGDEKTALETQCEREPIKEGKLLAHEESETVQEVAAQAPFTPLAVKDDVSEKDTIQPPLAAIDDILKKDNDPVEVLVAVKPSEEGPDKTKNVSHPETVQEAAEHAPVDLSAVKDDVSENNSKPLSAAMEDIVKKDNKPISMAVAVKPSEADKTKDVANTTQSFVNGNEDKMKSKMAEEVGQHIDNFVVVVEHKIEHDKDENEFLGKKDHKRQTQDEPPAVITSHSFTSGDETAPSTDNNSVSNSISSSDGHNATQHVAGKEEEISKLKEMLKQQGEELRSLEHKSLASKEQPCTSTASSSPALSNKKRTSFFSRLSSKLPGKNKNKNKMSSGGMGAPPQS